MQQPLIRPPVRLVRRPRLARRLACESGSATIETVLWLPVLFFVFALMIDASFMFYGRTEMIRVVQDAGRLRATNRLTTDTAAADYIRKALAPLKGTLTVSVKTDSAGILTTRVSMPAHDLQVLPYMSKLGNPAVGITLNHVVEEWNR